MPRHATFTARREFLSMLAVALLPGRLPWPMARGGVAPKTLGQYQAEGAAYAAALTALSTSPTSLSAHGALVDRVGGDLPKRLSRLVAEVAQDPRVAAGMRPILASGTAFSAFAKTVSADPRAALNVPGVQAAISAAAAREAALRREVLSRQSAFGLLLKDQARSNAPARLSAVAHVEVELARASDRLSADYAAAVVEAVALVAVAVVVATFTFGAASAAGTSAVVTAAAVAAGITAAVVTPFVQEATRQAEAAHDAIQDCMDDAWSRRRACRRAITTTFPPQREVEQGLCDGTYLTDVLACTA